jgi:hypothetical protein
MLGTTDETYNPNGEQDGYVYVPLGVITDNIILNSTNWSALQFRILEQYTIDWTTTGDFVGDYVDVLSDIKVTEPTTKSLVLNLRGFKKAPTEVKIYSNDDNVTANVTEITNEIIKFDLNILNVANSSISIEIIGDEGDITVGYGFWVYPAEV